MSTRVAGVPVAPKLPPRGGSMLEVLDFYVQQNGWNLLGMETVPTILDLHKDASQVLEPETSLIQAVHDRDLTEEELNEYYCKLTRVVCIRVSRFYGYILIPHKTMIYVR